MLARLQLTFYLCLLLAYSAGAKGSSQDQNSTVHIPVLCPDVFNPGTTYEITWGNSDDLKNSQDTIMSFQLSTSPHINNHSFVVNLFAPPYNVRLRDQMANITIPAPLNENAWMYVYCPKTATGKTIFGTCLMSPIGGPTTQGESSESSSSARNFHSGASRNLSKGAIAGIVTAVLLSLLAALLTIGLCYKSRRKRRNSQAPLLRAIPFNASATSMRKGPSTPAPRPWVTFYQPDEALPEYPASVAGTTTVRESKPVLLDQRAQMDGWYQGDSFERMQQLENGRQRMQELIQQFRARGEREWGVTQDELRPSTGYVVPNLR